MGDEKLSYCRKNAIKKLFNAMAYIAFINMALAFILSVICYFNPDASTRLASFFLPLVNTSAYFLPATENVFSGDYPNVLYRVISTFTSIASILMSLCMLALIFLGFLTSPTAIAKGTCNAFKLRPYSGNMLFCVLVINTGLFFFILLKNIFIEGQPLILKGLFLMWFFPSLASFFLMTIFFAIAFDISYVAYGFSLMLAKK